MAVESLTAARSLQLEESAAAAVSSFFGHLVVADEQIHSRELLAVELLLSSLDPSGGLYQPFKLVLDDSEEKSLLTGIVPILLKLGKSEFEQVIRGALYIAHSDGYYDDRERELVEEVLKRAKNHDIDYAALVEEASASFEDEEVSSDLHPLAESLRPLMRSLANAARPFVKGEIKTWLERIERRLLLAGPEYQEAIEKCAAVSRHDFEIIAKYINDATTNLERLKNQVDASLGNVADKAKMDEIDVEALLSELRTSLEGLVEQRLTVYRDSLYKKKRAMNSYTISFIGKTKAGKSTLHAVITGEGDDFIGRGMQRTTRFNRVYTWKRIRIIDTPGIGAPGGKTDEEIAESIVDESDVICFLVKNDSIQESEFEFLRLIRKRNKPVIILLNAKENLENEKRLSRYLEDPEKWYQRQDGRSLQGHVDRIREYAKKHYGSDYFEIFPVQLLAAKMAADPQYRKHAKALYRSSHIQDFLDALRVTIIEEGILKRSQTLIDGTLYVLKQTHSELMDYREPLTTLQERLENKRIQLPQQLERSYAIGQRQLQGQIEELFSRLVGDARGFAARHYDKSSYEIEEAWRRRLAREGFEQYLSAAFQSAVDTYVKDVQDYLEEFEQDLQVVGKDDSFQVYFSPEKIGLGTIAKVGLLSLGAGALAAIGLGPLGIAAGILFGLATFVGGLFKSKEKKRAEAIEKLTDALYDAIREQKREVLKAADDKFSKLHRNTLQQLGSYFGIMVQTARVVNDELGLVIHELDECIGELERLFAWRAINFARFGMDAPEEINLEQVESEVFSVEREAGKAFVITASETVTEQTMDKLTKALQERVIIRGRNSDGARI